MPVSDFKKLDCFAYTSALWCHTEKFLSSRWIYGSPLSYKIRPSLLAYLYQEKLRKIGGVVFWSHPELFTIYEHQKWHFFKNVIFIFSIRFSTLDHKIKSEGKFILPSRINFGPKIENLQKLLLGFFYHPLYHISDRISYHISYIMYYIPYQEARGLLYGSEKNPIKSLLLGNKMLLPS